MGKTRHLKGKEYKELIVAALEQAVNSRFRLIPDNMYWSCYAQNARGPVVASLIATKVYAKSM